MADRIALTAVEGLRVGQRTREDRPTGCTVILAEHGATAGVSVRGYAPGTRETDLLAAASTVQQINAVVLSGGSAFGLASADGVMQSLRRRGIGYQTRGGAVPIVPAAILFDLGIGEGDSYPDAADGAAALAAATSEPPAEGSVGAGAGATVGKLFGLRYAMKGGIGSGGYRFADGTIVAALIAVNCVGDVRDHRTGALLAGARTPDGLSLRDAEAELLRGQSTITGAASNTVIGAVATNRTLDKAACNRLAAVAHDGLARAVVPAHTRHDGDTLFFLATGTLEPPDDDVQVRLEVATAAAVAEAVGSAIRSATGLPDLPSATEFGRL